MTSCWPLYWFLTLTMLLVWFQCLQVSNTVRYCVFIVHIIYDRIIWPSGRHDIVYDMWRLFKHTMKKKTGNTSFKDRWIEIITLSCQILEL